MDRNKRLLDNIDNRIFEELLRTIDKKTIMDNFDFYLEYIFQQMDIRYEEIKNQMKFDFVNNSNFININIGSIVLDPIDIVENGGKDSIRNRKIDDILNKK